MAFEKYVKLPGSEREPKSGSVKTGAAHPDELMQVTVALRPRSGQKETVVGQAGGTRRDPFAR